MERSSRMDFPADLPGILHYRVGATVRATLPRTPVVYVSSSGSTNAATVCPCIPLGATGWRLAGEREWKPLSALPAAWMPFLNRARGSAMDPRPAMKE